MNEEDRSILRLICQGMEELTIGYGPLSNEDRLELMIRANQILELLSIETEDKP